MSTKGRSDYYAPGDYNACCDRCCAKFKASKLKKDWRGFMLCEWCWEPRHPQDFVRGLADPTPVPWVRICSHDNFVQLCAVPTASFTVEVSAEDPLTISYASTTPSSDACPVTCAYDFGDGNTSTSCSGSHTYAAGGTYTISYTATNPSGEDTTTVTLTVVEPPPAYATELTINFEDAGVNISSAAPLGVTFDAPFYEGVDLSAPGQDPVTAPEGTKYGGFHTLNVVGYIVTINIDTEKLRTRSLTLYWRYTATDYATIYMSSGQSAILALAATSVDEFTSATLYTDAQLTGLSLAGYVNKIVFNRTDSGYFFCDVLHFF